MVVAGTALNGVGAFEFCNVVVVVAWCKGLHKVQERAGAGNKARVQNMSASWRYSSAGAEVAACD
jgi:hypothetical protein